MKRRKITDQVAHRRRSRIPLRPASKTDALLLEMIHVLAQARHPEPPEHGRRDDRND